MNTQRTYNMLMQALTKMDRSGHAGPDKKGSGQEESCRLRRMRRAC